MLIIYGYLLMALLLGIIIFGVGVYCLYKSWGNLEQGTERNSKIDRIVDITQQIPVVNNFDQYRLKRWDAPTYKRQTTRTFLRTQSHRSQNN